MLRPRLFFLLILSLVISSCSLNKIAVNSMSNLLYKASNEVESEYNYEVFKNGIFGNLLLMEGMLSESPENKDLLLALSKGYAALAFAVNETDMMEDLWSESKSEGAKLQALFNYTRSMNYGLRFLKIKKIEFSDLIAKMNEPKGIEHLLDDHLSSDELDIEAVLFTAQSFLALINLQKDNISTIAQLPAAKSMFDWVCTKSPEINHGACDIFYGALEAGKPKLLGGNPKKANDIFLRAIEKNPHNWLIRASYIQYYLIPHYDQAGFMAQMDFFKNARNEFNSFHIYSAGPNLKDMPWSQDNSIRLFQSIALKRFELMNKYQKQFF